MRITRETTGYHYTADEGALQQDDAPSSAPYYYLFTNFFHPFVDDLKQQLNEYSISGMLDPAFLKGLRYPFGYKIVDTSRVKTTGEGIDLSIGGTYANYNWELFYHIPVMIAVHLSNNQRFAEAQKWFHYVFDPTCTDTKVPAPQRFWKFLAFRNIEGDGGDLPLYSDIQNINTLLTLLSTPDDDLTENQKKEKKAVFRGYEAIVANQFQPHAVARLRPGAYQWYVVMKYLDNLIAWGDSLFLQNTIETINEATLCYVLAANILGPRPQALPQRGVVKPKNYLQLKQASRDDPIGNALVELEGQFPFNMASEPSSGSSGSDQSGALFGIGHTLYFCIPHNPNLLAYWDTVADRLFKIRNSQNILGIVQQLPLFDPPLDPGILVKAAAAGIDIGSVVSGLNQPLGPVRAPLLIQKALELAGEVRSLGNALLASIEKGEAEHLALLRQRHEVTLQTLVQNVRYMQVKHAEEATEVLLKTRASAFERYKYYLHLCGLSPDVQRPEDFKVDHNAEFTEYDFDDLYSKLITAYDLPLNVPEYPDPQVAGNSSPSNQSGASGQGDLYLNVHESEDLNNHSPTERDSTVNSITFHSLASALTPIPDAKGNLHFLGLGGTADIPIGQALSRAASIAGDIHGINAAVERAQGGMALKTGTYKWRAMERLFQRNLAARELMQIGRQIIGSLIAEQIARHDYQTVRTQAQNAQEILKFLQEEKFTKAEDADGNPALYEWQESEISGLYYQYYRVAVDIARKAEQTMKRELMRPELDSKSYIQFNYFDNGYKGLLSGEALYLDLKRMEMDYHDSNKRELELTRHVSLRQLDPLALLGLKLNGSCTLTIPEWLYDLDCPGLYMRRIKSVALSIPCVAGPYTSVSCVLNLQSSTLRVSPLLKDGKWYRSTDPADDDNRFASYYGVGETIVTSSGANDSGMFETNLRDERFLPFEGAGAESTWNLTLPGSASQSGSGAPLRTFDYMTIADAILHIRYTARDAGLRSQVTAELKAMLRDSAQAPQAMMFNLRYDFSTEWSAFVNGTADFSATLRKDYFPYLAQSATRLTVNNLTLYAASNDEVVQATLTTVDLKALSDLLNSSAGTANLSWPFDSTSSVMTRDPAQRVFLVLAYSTDFGG